MLFEFVFWMIKQPSHSLRAKALGGGKGFEVAGLGCRGAGRDELDTAHGNGFEGQFIAVLALLGAASVDHGLMKALTVGARW